MGLLEPQTEKIPDELPKEYRKLVGLLYKNIDNTAAEKLMPIIKTLEEQHTEVVSKDPDLQAAIARVYLSNKDLKKADDLYGKVAAQKPAYYLNLYMLAPKLNKPAEERQQYLDKYLAGAYETKDGAQRYDIDTAYDRVTAELFKAQEYEECLKVILREEKEKVKGTDEPIVLSVMVHYRKGRCYEALGKKQEAYEAYHLALFFMADKPRYKYTQKELEKRINKLSEELGR